VLNPRLSRRSPSASGRGASDSRLRGYRSTALRWTLDRVCVRRLRILAVVAGLSGIPGVTAAQQASIQGIVTSAVTGGPLEGVSVVLRAAGEHAYGTFTDRNGFYQIGGIGAGSYSLQGNHIGHAPHEREVTFAPGARLTVSFRLEARPVELEGVVVTPGGGATARDLGRQRVTPADLRLVPVPAGSGDLASYLQTLPGVVSTGDRGGQLFVRGGTPAENMVLIDGIPVYQPFHILGFFSVFPEDLVSSADFYAGGFGARYYGRTSAVLDVHLRDGDPNRRRVVASVSPFIAEALVEGPAGPGVTWIASARRSLVEETSSVLMGDRQPLTFDSQLFKLTMKDSDELRCSGLALRTSDRGRLDAEERESRVAWSNLVVGGRCVALFPNVLRLVEVNFGYSSVNNDAVSRGSSRLYSRIGRIHHEVNSTLLIGATPLYAGYHVYMELPEFDLAELYGMQQQIDLILGTGGYLEAAVPLGMRTDLRPGLVMTASPALGVEPRVRARWNLHQPTGGTLQGAAGLYRQDLVGTSDLRDVGSVFLAWMRAPNDVPMTAFHGVLGWQQSLGGRLSYSVDGYYKQLRRIPVPVWNAVAQFTTRLDRVDGEVYGADARLEYSSPRFRGFVGYGYGRTEYVVSQAAFNSWFGKPIQRYAPPHDRRHQVNTLAALEIAGFDASARWQLGSGLPFTRPLGFDEAFDYTVDLFNPSTHRGTSRMVLDRPYTGRLPVMHRLDVSLARDWELARGRLTAQAGAINVYNRRNMFYYDLFTGRRVDQLPLAPYASMTLRTR
jgi:hypothetical protein